MTSAESDEPISPVLYDLTPSGNAYYEVMSRPGSTVTRLRDVGCFLGDN